MTTRSTSNGRGHQPALVVIGVAMLVAIGGLIALTIATVKSQQQARDNAIGRFEDRASLSADLLSSTLSVSASNNAAAAAQQLSGDVTPNDLKAWEGDQDPEIPYTAVYDATGTRLAAFPANAKSVTTPAARRGLAAALQGVAGASAGGIVGGDRIVELDVPYRTPGGKSRVLVAGIPSPLIAALAEQTLRDAAGSDEGGAFVVDDSGAVFARIGPSGDRRAIEHDVSRAAKAGRKSGASGSHRFRLHPLGDTGLIVAVAAPERDIVEGLPSNTWPRLALGLLTATMIFMFALAIGLIRTRGELERARDDAERANEAKSRFLRNIAHELKTPLAVIRGFADLLRRGDVSDEHRDWAERILESGEQLSRLVAELLDIASIDAGKLDLDLEAVDVDDVVEETTRMVEPLANERGVTVHGPERAEPPTLATADPDRLRQVLLNLLTNAIKYNRDDGEVRVAVDDLGDSGVVRVTVSDTGRGIPDERLGELFQPFERLGASHGGEPGTGLGLVVSKGLVEAMDGSMQVDSTVDVGSSFSFTLRRAVVGGDG